MPSMQVRVYVLHAKQYTCVLLINLLFPSGDIAKFEQLRPAWESQVSLFQHLWKFHSLFSY